MKPSKPRPDFPLFAHQNGQWAKKVKGKLHYFGPWADPDGAEKAWQESNGSQERIPRRDRPAKPRADFPLFAHATGQWAKKVNGKLHYFGPWADPKAALTRWVKEKDDLLAGRQPSRGEGFTVRNLVDAFLKNRRRMVDCGELQEATWTDYDEACKRLMKVFGKARHVATLRPIDFEKLRANFAKTHGPSTLCGDIACVRAIFNFGYQSDLMDRPMKYGPGFARPSKAVLRRARKEKTEKHGPRMYQPEQLRELIDAAGVQVKAMILLGINCGFGNNDCAKLPKSALDLRGGWVDFGRPKTGIERRCPLWRETIEALEAAIKARPTPHEATDRVFVTKYGHTWEAKSKKDSPLSKEMAKLLASLGMHRPGLGFYALRHTFQTIGEKTRDKDAVRYLMGHAEDANDMSAVYSEERVEDDRLLAVVNHVRTWLYGRKVAAA